VDVGGAPVNSAPGIALDSTELLDNDLRSQNGM